MKATLLLSNRFKKLGWLIFTPATVVGLLQTIYDYQASWLNVKVPAVLSNDLGGNIFFSIIQNNITDEIIALLFLIGGLLVAFSKEKNEDEFISSVRLKSLLWAVFVNYALLFLSFLFVYGFSFLTVMLYNMFTVLIIFIIRFNYVLYKNSKIMSDEK